MCLICGICRTQHRTRSSPWILLYIGIFLNNAVLHRISGLPNLIRIGGLFDDVEDASIESAFRYAILRVNEDKSLLPHTKIAYDIQHLPSHNSFLASKKACNQAGLGVAAVFGPRSRALSGHINSMCNALEIPHLEARLEPEIYHKELFSMNLYPDTHQLSQAFLALLKHFKWKKFCVVYGDEKDLLLLQDIIREPILNDPKILVRQAREGSMREMLKEIDKKGVTKIIAHLDSHDTYHLLKAALQLGMIDPGHHFILTNLDIETIDMEDVRHNGVNLTGFRLVDQDELATREILKQMDRYQRRSGARLLNNSYVIQAETALMYDAVHVMAHALQQVDASTRLRLVNLSCDGDQAWAFGSSLYNYLNLVKYDGLTGRITFDRGRRNQFKLDIMQLKGNGLLKVGHWTTTSGIKITAPAEVLFTGNMFSNKTLKVTTILKTLKVTTILEPPYVMEKESDTPLVGNDRYEGFCIELLEAVAQEVGFKYEVYLVPDEKYGIKVEPGIWNGMVGELMTGKADLAVASLTISYTREQVIDFTKPFMNLGISILFKKPRRESPGLFSFLNPLAIEIWLYVIAAYFVVSLIMYVLARFSPYEWYNPHPCNPDHDVVENVFTLSNSFWFAVGTLMQQGSDINPRAVSTRIVGGIWWFFTLIIISSYTANLAAFLTVERMVSPIESAEDLATQTKISYGTIAGGSTMTFFQDSKIPTYMKMWAFMESQEPGVFVKESKDGIDRVLKEDYAFLMESTMIDYNVQRNCELMQVGGLLDSKGYGIGTPRDSTFRDAISMAILDLQEKGRIQIMYNKWWKNTGTCNPDDSKKDSKANSLGVANVGGIFVVLFVGLAIAVLIAVVEFIWNSRKNAEADRQSVWSEMMEELRFAIRCHGSTKKPALRRQCSKCVHHPTDSCTVDSPNGIIQLRDLKQKSPLSHREPAFRYRDSSDTYGDYRPTYHLDASFRDPSTT